MVSITGRQIALDLLGHRSGLAPRPGLLRVQDVNQFLYDPLVSAAAVIHGVLEKLDHRLVTGRIDIHLEPGQSIDVPIELVNEALACAGKLELLDKGFAECGFSHGLRQQESHGGVVGHPVYGRLIA